MNYHSAAFFQLFEALIVTRILIGVQGKKESEEKREGGGGEEWN